MRWAALVRRPATRLRQLQRKEPFGSSSSWHPGSLPRPAEPRFGVSWSSNTASNFPSRLGALTPGQMTPGQMPSRRRAGPVSRSRVREFAAKVVPSLPRSSHDRPREQLRSSTRRGDRYGYGTWDTPDATWSHTRRDSRGSSPAGSTPGDHRNLRLEVPTPGLKNHSVPPQTQKPPNRFTTFFTFLRNGRRELGCVCRKSI